MNLKYMKERAPKCPIPGEICTKKLEPYSLVNLPRERRGLSVFLKIMEKFPNFTNCLHIKKKKKKN